MSSKVSENIRKVILNCGICQKFAKSISRPKVMLPKLTTFNEIVTLDLRAFGLKHVLWISNSFIRFVQGKLITNKRADTIVQALND